MAALQLNLPPSIHAQLQARATESGYKNIEEYAEAVLRADAEQQLVDEDIEALLLERLDDPRPNIEFNEQFKQDFRNRIRSRRKTGS